MMKRKLSNAGIPAAAAVLLGCCSVLFVSGCSGNKKASPFQVIFSAAYVNENAVAEYKTSLLGSIPELTVDGTAPLFTSMVVGESRNDPESGVIGGDPMMNMAGMMRMAAVVSTGEMDVFISDMDNAARNARGEMFMSLDRVFPGENLSAYDDRLLSFDIMTTDGNEPRPTGEKTPVCGISITGNAQMRRIFGDQEIGVFIVANTKNLETAKKIMRSLM